MRRRLLFLLFAATLTLHCSRNIITREQYLSKTSDQRDLIVRSMMGGEHAEDAKGNRGSRYTKSVAEYRTAIEKKYAEGDQRPVTEIWKELKD